MHARYERALNERLLPALLPGGAFSFLVTERPVDDPFALDVQLRERNKIVFYHGMTRLLTVQLRIGANGEVEARAHAATAYGECEGCKEQYRALMKWWAIGEATAFRAALRAYLPAAVAAADPSYYRNRQEGYWQNRLCLRFGRQWTPQDEWLIIDRDCVIGFNNADEQKRFYERTRHAYQGVKDRLQNDDKGAWGEPDGQEFGDELDLLAINRNGDLATIELRHGDSASGIYWAPLQVGVYRDAFEAILSSVRPGIQELVRQKITLGLLPEAAGVRLEVSELKRVEPIVAVAEPRARSSCWQKMRQVVAEMARAGIPQPALPLRVAQLTAGADDLDLAFMPALA